MEKDVGKGHYSICSCFCFVSLSSNRSGLMQCGKDIFWLFSSTVPPVKKTNAAFFRINYDWFNILWFVFSEEWYSIIACRLQAILCSHIVVLVHFQGRRQSRQVNGVIWNELATIQSTVSAFSDISKSLKAILLPWRIALFPVSLYTCTHVPPP
jgi:hypothetical protein